MERADRTTVLRHARVLASPKFRGREAGGKSIRLAARYIADQFRRLGLKPGGAGGSYDQRFKIRAGLRMEGELRAFIGKVPMADLKLGVDYMPLNAPGRPVELEAPCLLAGYGITSPALKFDEYAGLDAKGKAVLVFAGAPWGSRAAAWLRRGPEPRPVESIDYKAENAARVGAKCLLVAPDPAALPPKMGVRRPLGLPDPGRGFPLPVARVSPRLVSALTGMTEDEVRLFAEEIARERRPQSMLLRGRRLQWTADVRGRAVLGRNLVAVWPGRDERLRREAVVVGAHYDHLGEEDDSILFGANDNAAGVGALLAVARAFTALPRPPRRTLVFVAFDAEEIGRLGSGHYVANAVVPAKRTVLMINFDMIGRNAPDAIYAVATRSSPELHRLHKAVNAAVGLALVHPLSYRLGRSDHTAFYRAGIPVMYLFGGIDPDYNTPRDTWDKLIPAKVERVARLAFLTAWAAAEREERLRFVGGGDYRRVTPRRGER